MENIQVVLPPNLENMVLPDPDLVNLYREREERIIWIDDDVTTHTMEIGKQILKWNIEDRGKKKKKIKPIILLINSYGGDLDICNSLIDIISGSPTPIIGVNMGTAASAACFIFLACHKRYMFPRATFLIHRGSGSFSGTFEQVLAHAAEYQRSLDEIVDFIRKQTAFPDEIINERIYTEWYVNKDEAIQYKIAEIIMNINEVLDIREKMQNG